jgi:hypothetical protein
VICCSLFDVKKKTVKNTEPKPIKVGTRLAFDFRRLPLVVCCLPTHA